MQSGKKGITFQQFSSTQLVPSTPKNGPFETYNAFDHVWHSGRMHEAKSNSLAFNEAKARARAARLQNALAWDVEMALHWLGPEDIAVDEEAPGGHRTNPLPPMSSFGRSRKVVRFSDEVDTAQFDFVRAKQCELNSSHELLLKAFTSQVTSAKASSHALNESKALSRGFRQRTEIEVQQEEDEMTNRRLNVMEEEAEPWVVIDATAEDRRGAGSSPDEGQTQQKRIKKCFWILDTRCMPGEQPKSCEDKRWQDHVRCCTEIV
eukprot:TRINITY_DN7236_c0_g1_i2.p1 TRINITY_DN7236_c0_g1~~TRINITY_DN7236_c0_g1_i2.p1  ORF type:complete len:263 (-),score=40.67 TRINITY_DN7236_c0_g1_i2:289-1077(-)